jgi:hypothetical protein
VKLFRKKNSKLYWYDFTVRGRRSWVTQETKSARAKKAASLKLASVIEGTDPLPSKPNIEEGKQRRVQAPITGPMSRSTQMGPVNYPSGHKSSTCYVTAMTGDCNQMCKEDARRFQPFLLRGGHVQKSQSSRAENFGTNCPNPPSKCRL